MNIRQILLAFVLLDFLALNALAIHEFGLIGVFTEVTASAWTLLVSADLVIALCAAVYWMWQDAKRRDMNPLPYALLTAGTGSAGLLVYLIRRESSAAAPAPQLSPAK